MPRQREVPVIGFLRLDWFSETLKSTMLCQPKLTWLLWSGIVFPGKGDRKNERQPQSCPLFFCFGIQRQLFQVLADSFGHLKHVQALLAKNRL
jgi:hypothetical protein